ncbi:MAG: hypothetical protein KA004_19345 [Verrucomicrobiales bacterium]|nr:hypothetical protein [Verrucomicrobiales bacterium]
MWKIDWDTLDKIGTLVGLLAFLGTAYSAWRWWRHQRREKVLDMPIPIRLVDGESGRTLLELPHQPPRRNVTRAEVLGLLGMIPSRQQRFDWRHLHSPQFMTQLNEVYRGRRGELSIPVTAAEFAQLDLQ